ncbi:MAG TPA: hypothetical protein VI757_00845 [Bacteroidia bacterium]|nr:hypothetical protein [Bacteroidia bacterium]
MKNYVRRKLFAALLSGVVLSMPIFLFAQDGEPTIKLSVIENDTQKICNAVVMVNDTTPVKGTDVNFYVKRFFGLLPLALTETTDENGEAKAIFQKQLPGDSVGNITLIAQLDDDESVSDHVVVPWGIKAKSETTFNKRELWASKSNAPLYLIITSNAIIAGIWGTMGYILFLLFFRMKKSGLDYEP